MSRRLIYLFPCLMDISVAIMLFASPTLLATRDHSAIVVAAVLATWGLFYMFTGYALSILVTEKNAVIFLLSSCVSFVLIAVAFAMFKETTIGVFATSAAFGIVNAAFFAPFQVFMKCVDKGNGRSVCYSAAFYTFSWSIGIAIGRYAGGYLSQNFGWTVCYLGIAPPAIISFFGIYYIKHFAHTLPVENTENDNPAIPKKLVMLYDTMPDLAWMGWLFAGLGITGVAVVGSVFPKLATELNIELVYQGSAMFVMFIVQAIVAFLLRNGRTWMYRPWPIFCFAFVGAMGMLLFGIAKNSWTFHIAAGLFGVFTGANFVYFVFHSLVHPMNSARYVSINETVVGLTGIIGPLLAGFIAYQIALPAPFYLFGITMLVAATVQVTLHARHREDVKQLLASHSNGY